MQILKHISSVSEVWPYFATAQYLRTISNDYGWFVDGESVLAFIRAKRIGFHVLQFQSNVFSQITGEPLSEDEERLFLNTAVKHLSSMGIHLVIQPPTHVLFKSFPNGAIAAPFGSYRIDLRHDLETLFANIHSKHRNVIRKAEKEGVVIANGHEYLQIAVNIVNRTLANQNIKPINYENLSEAVMVNKNNWDVFLAMKDGEPMAAAIIPWTQFSAYYLYGGTSEKPILGAMNFLQWEAIKVMKARGVYWYDFVGARINPDPQSKLAGIQLFKSRFGPKLVVGYMWKYPVNIFAYYCYQLAQRVWSLKQRRRWQGDIIDQERAREDIILNL